MAVSFEVPLMHVNYSDFRLRSPQIPSAAVSTNKNLNVHLNILKRLQPILKIKIRGNCKTNNVFK